MCLDVFGCLCAVGDVEIVGGGWKKRDIRVLTNYSVTSKITLWGNLGETFNPDLYNKDDGEVSFSTTSASKIYINIQIDYVTSLIERFSTISNGVKTIASSNMNKTTLEEDMFVNRMIIEELLQADWSGELKEYIVTLRGKIIEIDNSFGWYKIHIKVMEKTANTTLVLFNVVAEKLLDTSAHKLFNELSSNNNDVPAEIQNLCGKDFVYKLRLNDYNLKEGLENFTVSKDPHNANDLEDFDGDYQKKKKRRNQMVDGHDEVGGNLLQSHGTTTNENNKSLQNDQNNKKNKGKHILHTVQHGPIKSVCFSFNENIHESTYFSLDGASSNNAHYTTPWNFGIPSYTCQYCGAILWYEERTKKTQKVSDPKFTFCCMEGRVHIPLLKEAPPLLKFLLGPNSGQKEFKFRKNIRAYNSMFAFTSMGGRVDTSINQSAGPYIFRMSGQNYHHIGSLLPEVGKKPQFAQLYIYDTENDIGNQMDTLLRHGRKTEIEHEIVHELSQMLDQHNNLVKSFRMARDRFKAQPESTFRLRLLSSRTTDGRQYNMPTSSEVAGLIVGDFSEANFERDVIVEHRTKGIQRITDLHPSFMSMTYPLIHPYGEDEYRLGIPLRDVTESSFKRQKLTMRQHYCFWLQQRLNEGHTLLRSGRLLQQYIVDSYMAIEEERFRWIRNNQNKLRSDLFSGLMDDIHHSDSDCSKVGKSIIFPSSHTGGPRYRVQNYQDAMAICKWAGYPDLFLTFTCNPKWQEINDMIHLIGQKDDNNRVDIICRVFETKLFQLMHDLKKEQLFGKIISCIYTIEFQKRGLPHAHILLFLHSTLKNPSADHIDNIISAEIPDLNVDPDGYNAVNKFMIHGPCGKLNSNSPCMMQDRNLVVKFDAHINVEVCNYSRSVKYLFKYVHKGSDKTTATMESIDTAKEIDEIKTYLDCRYITATEACWRIFQFDIHYRQPTIERLPFHLLGEHTVIFKENKCVENVVCMPGIEKTKFTQWLEANKNYDDARELTYSDFPISWVWNSKEKTWTRRKNGLAIGRIYFAHPSTGERFYLRMLLNFVKGSTSYESIRTINGVTYPNFKGACYALGLLDDDKEWIDCLTEAAIWATGKELRHLFVTILIHYQVSDASQLWKSNYIALSEDITSLQMKRFRMNDLKLTKQQVEAYTLFEIESIMLKMGKSLKDIDGMPLPNPSLIRDSGNRLVNEELDYDRDQLKILHEKSFAALNPCQKSAYKAIVHSVENEQALDKTLRDILRTRFENSYNKPFGGLTIVCGGDFRQILPVVPKGTRADIVNASLNSSYLWPFFKIYELNQNMRLYNGSLTGFEAAKIASFDKWMLQI
ncbi:uncharacterized protein LOC133791836 [Humulus lupulus]|uniref:uncharacterized protein LOC133791836 n=1 Tax=Humulus lupulus TaxID=3486 RepID=UPI002B40B609|nr:uncharacterized protein LOC133791836 [Humulus lupulus]